MLDRLRPRLSDSDRRLRRLEGANIQQSGRSPLRETKEVGGEEDLRQIRLSRDLGDGALGALLRRLRSRFADASDLLFDRERGRR